MEFCYSPFTLGEALRGTLEEPPATLQILPNGQVKVAAVLPYVCADLRTGSLEEAWSAYGGAWANEQVLAAARGAIEHEWHHPDANNWRRLTVSKSGQREAKWAT